MFFLSHQNHSDSVVREFSKQLNENQKKVDKAFVWLLLVEWIAVILIAIAYSPQAWSNVPNIHNLNIWAAIVLGGIVSIGSLIVARLKPGSLFSRQTIAFSQFVFAALLTHLTAGKVESHMFVSLALLVAYRDRSVFVIPVVLTTADHFIRGMWWPQSVLGIAEFNWFHPVEHAFWLVLETAGLTYVIHENLKHWLNNASLQAVLKSERDQLEVRVNERTKTLKCLQQFREEILNSIDASICIIDSKGKIVFVNEKWTMFSEEHGLSKSCGLGAAYLTDCGLAMLGAPEFVELVASQVKLISIGESDEFCSEYSFQSKSDLRHYRLSITPVALDGELGVAIVHVDVTHLKRAERRASALAKLIQESPDEVLIAEVQSGRFIEANDGAASNIGFDQAEMLEMELWELFDETQGSIVKSALFRVATNGDTVARFESQIRRKDGSHYPCRISLHRTHFEDSDVWVFYITDLTEQKELENKLQQSQKLEALGTLAAGIAHEINTPMQCVVGNFEFLQNSFKKLTALSDRMVELLDASNVDWSHERNQLQDLRKEYKYNFLRKQTPMALEEAADSSRKIVSIVRAMKAMSHPGTDEAVETDLQELIQNASIISRNRWKYVSDMTFQFAPDMPKIYGFPAELSQVFVNLFVNATDAIIERLGPEPRVLGLIAVDTKVTGDLVIIRVRDTGNGIPEAIRKKIFDPFFTTKPVGKGTGQGLSITHSVIVNKHGGSITVSSEVGIGTVFTIALPISRNAPREQTLPLASISGSNIAVPITTTTSTSTTSTSSTSTLTT